MSRPYIVSESEFEDLVILDRSLITPHGSPKQIYNQHVAYRTRLARFIKAALVSPRDSIPEINPDDSYYAAIISTHQAVEDSLMDLDGIKLKGIVFINFSRHNALSIPEDFLGEIDEVHFYDANEYSMMNTEDIEDRLDAPIGIQLGEYTSVVGIHGRSAKIVTIDNLSDLPYLNTVMSMYVPGVINPHFRQFKKFFRFTGSTPHIVDVDPRSSMNVAYTGPYLDLKNSAWISLSLFESDGEIFRRNIEAGYRPIALNIIRDSDTSMYLPRKLDSLIAIHGVVVGINPIRFRDMPNLKICDLIYTNSSDIGNDLEKLKDLQLLRLQALHPKLLSYSAKFNSLPSLRYLELTREIPQSVLDISHELDALVINNPLKEELAKLTIGDFLAPPKQFYVSTRDYFISIPSNLYRETNEDIAEVQEMKIAESYPDLTESNWNIQPVIY